MNGRIGTALGLFLVLCGCASQKIVLQDPNDMEPPTAVFRQTFFLYGIAQSRQINAAAVCGSSGNVKRVETQQTFVDAVLGVVTVGIYSPRSTKIYCRQ